MIKVDDKRIEVEGDIPQIAADIHMVFSGMKQNLSDEEFHYFKEIVIWGIFDTQCTQLEIIEIMQGYERFRAFKEKNIGD